MAGDLAANIEAGQGPVDYAGFITMLIGLLFAQMAPERDVITSLLAAFELHKKASHYLEFNRLVSEMVTAKSVRLLKKINH